MNARELLRLFQGTLERDATIRGQVTLEMSNSDEACGIFEATVLSPTDDGKIREIKIVAKDMGTALPLYESK